MINGICCGSGSLTPDIQVFLFTLFKKGYRTSSRNSHVATLKFAEIFLDEYDVLYFDRMRRKRHRAVYDTAGTISKNEAENAIARAETIIEKVKNLIE